MIRLMMVLIVTAAGLMSCYFVPPVSRSILKVPEAPDPKACSAENDPNKDCSRWYNLDEDDDPDACEAARASGEKCGRWYSIRKPITKPVVIILRGIHFDTAKANIRPESIPILENNIKALRQKPYVFITIEGHTDWRGTDSYNQKLSEARATSVLNWLASHGISRLRMRAIGKGESEPVGDNKTEEGMSLNRRIELHLN